MTASHQVSQNGGIALLNVGELGGNWKDAKAAKIVTGDNVLPPPYASKHEAYVSCKLHNASNSIGEIVKK